MTSPFTWVPTDEHVERANVTRLARRHGLSGIDELRAASTADIAWYWQAVVEDLGLPFQAPCDVVVDRSGGDEHAEWFVGADLNVVDACVHRWRDDPGTRDAAAITYEGESGTTRSLTFAELAGQVDRVAAGLRDLGIGRGDAVGLYLPMVPEAVVAFYAVARLGGIVVPLFSGYAAGAIASRLQDASAKAVVVGDWTQRRGKRVPMRATMREALRSCPTVSAVVVVPGPDGADPALGPGERSWLEVAAAPPLVDDERTPAGTTLLLAYTSGTTGRPKGAVHTHAGFLVKVASEAAYSFDVGRGDVFTWISDMGWIMGPLSTIGAHANGATLFLYDGAPDVPSLDRLWEVCERHRITVLGVSPTLVRSLQRAPELPRADLSSVRILGSTGEPWDPDSYSWLAGSVFSGRVPIINISGGTEVGGSLLSPYPVEAIAACSLGGPSLGMDVDVVDPQGRSLRGEVGELVCRQPWPSMTRGIWGDPDRYVESYWSTFPGLWRQGDWALVEGGQWYILGRSDDVMNVAGKRLGPAEVESILVGHAAVSEAAAVGVPDATKGEVVWAFWVAAPGAGDVSDELAELVGAELGRPFRPALVAQVGQLPKTRSGKLMRRTVRAAALDLDPGDISTAENPEAIEEIRRATSGLGLHAGGQR